MKQPLLTIIVPTFNRIETLPFTIKTILSQGYERFEILVSNNCSTDSTKQYILALNDTRIKYVEPDVKLSMSHHWEFALKHVNEGFVTILGDDDGLMPNALSKISSLIEKYDVQAIGWRFCNFNWKGLMPHFKIPVSSYYKIIESKSAMREIFNDSIYNTINFPSLYGGFIDINLIKQLKRKYDNNFFHSRIPDFFSGGLIAASIDKYIRCEFPISINATSKFSTGYATMNEKNDQKSFNDLRLGDSNIPFHKKLIFIRSNAIPICEAMLQVHELVPTFPTPNIFDVLIEVIKEAQQKESIEIYKNLICEVKKIAEINGLSKEFMDIETKYPYLNVKYVIKNKFSPISSTLYIDTTDLNINTVCDAVKVAEKYQARHNFKVTNSFQILFFRLLDALRYFYIRYRLKF